MTAAEVLRESLERGTNVEVVVSSCVQTCCGGKTQRYDTELTARGKVTAIEANYFTMQVRWLGRLGSLVAEHQDLLDARLIVD